MSVATLYASFRSLGCALGVSLLVACGGGGETASNPTPNDPNANGGGAGGAAATPAGSTGEAAAPKDSNGVPDSEFGVAALAAINEARAVPRACGETVYPPVPAIRWNNLATEAALLESQFMQANNFWGHVWPDGTSVGERLSRVGYNWQAAGENIAAGFPSLEGVMKAWLDSPGHCVNIMRADIDEVGVSLVLGTGGNTYNSYWTMVLAKQAQTPTQTQSPL